MAQDRIYEIPAEIAASAHINESQYQAMYARSMAEPESFWAEQGHPKTALTWDIDVGAEHTVWPETGSVTMLLFVV